MTGDVDTSATHNILLEIQYIQTYSGCTYSTKIACDKVLQCGLRSHEVMKGISVSLETLQHTIDRYTRKETRLNPRCHFTGHTQSAKP